MVVSCPKCQYDLAGASSARCPECGAEIDRRPHVPKPRRWPQRSAVSVAAGGALALLPLARLSLSSGWPEWWSPLALWLFLRSHTFGTPVAYSWLLCLIPTISVLLCNPGLFKGDPRVSVGHTVFAAVLVGSNLLVIVWFSPHVLDYQGLLRFSCVTAINSGLLIALATLWLLLRVRPHFLLSFAFRWITWSWLTLYVFPYVAEMP